MTRARNRLNPKAIPTLSIGRHGDGDGLYLLVRQRGSSIERLWVYRYKAGARGEAKERSISLGPLRDVSLSKAREKAAECREAIREGRDPKEAIKAVVGVTFGEVADALIKSHVPSFKNEKHRAQWETTLSDQYCETLRKIPVDQVTTEHVLEVLGPLWLTTPETASRLRGRIEKVLDRAKVRKLRSGDNPARWKGHLSHLLAKPNKLSRGHHKALPWPQVPAFVADLRQLDSMSALALEWTILNVARTNETVHGERKEIDRDKKVWIIPAARMKAGREHRVPLCDRSMEILEETDKIGGKWLFPGQTTRKPLSLAAMAECLKGFNLPATVHGFRSSFRDWVSEATMFPDNLAEAALAHVVGDKTERAYKRGDALEKRRELMAAWERYLSQHAATVVQIRPAKIER